MWHKQLGQISPIAGRTAPSLFANTKGLMTKPTSSSVAPASPSGQHMPKAIGARYSQAFIKAVMKLYSRRPIVLIGLIALFVAIAGNWALPPLDRDEARFVQATTQMLESGDFINIRFLDDARNKKPVGIYWLQSAMVSVFSSPEARAIWAYRLVSLTSAVVAAIFTFLIGRILITKPAGFLGALLLVSAPLFAAEATIAKTDATLLALICAAQFYLVKLLHPPPSAVPSIGNVVGFWAAHGVATLIKGPLGLIFSLSTIAGVHSRHKIVRPLRTLRPAMGLAIMLAIVLPWAIMIGIETDGAFYRDAIGKDLLGKVGTAQEFHVGPPGYHLALLPILLWPAALFLPGAAKNAWKKKEFWGVRFLLSWIIPGWLIFELSATKLPHYVLPTYPAIALLVGHAIASNVGKSRNLFDKAGAGLHGLVGLAFVGAIFAVPMIYDQPQLFPIAIPLAVLVLAGTALTLRLFLTKRTIKASISSAAVSLVLAWGLLQFMLPQIELLGVAPKVADALRAQERHPIEHGAPPVGLSGYHEPSAVFLLSSQTRLGGGGAIARALLNGEIGTAVVEGRELAAFEAALGAKNFETERLGEISGLNYSNGKNVRVVIFAPKEAE